MIQATKELDAMGMGLNSISGNPPEISTQALCDIGVGKMSVSFMTTTSPDNTLTTTTHRSNKTYNTLWNVLSYENKSVLSCLVLACRSCCSAVRSCGSVWGGGGGGDGFHRRTR